MILEGKARRFGDNVSTDDIIAGKYKNRILDIAELAKHAMENVAPGFYDTFTAGQIIVGGGNFGTGSSREAAPLVLRQIGCAAVVAGSFARIFFRNSFNVGLRLIECDTSGIEEGNLLRIDLGLGTLANLTQGTEHLFHAPPPFMNRVLEEGGLIRHFKKHGRFAF